MQWPIVLFFLIGLICLAVGLLKSWANQPAGARHFCTSCGWTTEQVQFCQVEKHRATIVVPLCFECAMKQDAIPVKAFPFGGYSKA
jgi:hypothetical protein